MLHRIGTALVVLLALAGVSPQAWAAEFRVNTHTTGDQQGPRVAALGDGGFVVIWTSGSVNGSFGGTQDGSGSGVYFRRYNAGGVRGFFGEFRANTTTANDQIGASVAGLSNGGFVVTWTSKEQDGSGYGVYGQRYSATGFRVGTEFRVNTTTLSDQSGPSVAAGLPGGGFVVTWTSRRQDGFGDGVYGQCYGAIGGHRGAEFRVNTTTADDQFGPSVAVFKNGGFVVTWTSLDRFGSRHGVYGQRYGVACGRSGSEFRVNTITAGSQSSPSVAALSNGGFIVVWETSPSISSFASIHGQRYSAAGRPVGSEFDVDAVSGTHKVGPSVAALKDGGFVVTYNYLGDRLNPTSVRGRRYDAVRAPVGTQAFLVNAPSDDDREGPSVAGLNDGGFVVTWTSWFQDGDRAGVYGQRFSP